ncbi:uncharacterized protein MONBRDRAFT_31087 [Monosiga brevicollis MX1]|uniref:Uncharacterized protein n=1 Tax=Monosiga brevicollis TaxID=81824 RepID=A9URN3_MONBE|nr:uncharacterized protein MONBRDRAFT_31087 [Monosiga brevicollis MX1]EDQ91636.1 predicted protein [Monosiga brevicollis MX1]|eukprot:XP_001742922.1 hypothetical protein [Monosiga brevicollis MX1]
MEAAGKGRAGGGGAEGSKRAKGGSAGTPRKTGAKSGAKGDGSKATSRSPAKKGDKRRDGPPNRGKRPPPRPVARPEDIYIGRNSPFAAQLQRARQLLMSGESRVVLHGLNAAINRCINLALQLHREFGGEMTVATDTVALVDDLPPDDPFALPKTAQRPVSAVHITLVRGQRAA